MAENDTCGKTIQPTADQIKAALRLCAVAEPAGDYPCKQCYLYPLSRDGYMSTGETCFEHLVLDTCQLIDGLNDFDKTQSKILLARCQSLQAQLAESQRRERAAVRELNGILGQIDEDEYLRKAFCVHPGNEDCPSEKENGYVDVDDCVGCPLFENSWHGQEAGR